MPINALEGCPPYDPDGPDLYGYIPSRATGIVLCVLFVITLSAHLFQTIKWRVWWTSLFGIGALCEVLGWAGRLWSSRCPANLNAFLMQICCLCLAPTFYTAAVYVILGQLIKIMGRHTSPISARSYLYIFCVCDIISLVIQAVGGGMAGTAVAAEPPRDTDRGTHIMVAGIVFQMASITAFVALFGIFLQRVRREHERLSQRIVALVWASAFSVLLIYIRSIYRTIELSQGWRGYLITNEPYFIGLDGSLMFAAVAVYNLVHPGWALKGGKDISKQRAIGFGDAVESTSSPKK